MKKELAEMQIEAFNVGVKIGKMEFSQISFNNGYKKGENNGKILGIFLGSFATLIAVLIINSIS